LVVDFDSVIDKLDEKSLKEFHAKLEEHGCYQGLLNINEIDRGDIDQVRKAVKVGVQGAGYEKIKEIGPDSIKKEIETIDNEPIMVLPDLELEQDLPDESKEKLIQELIQINEHRLPGIGVPEQYRTRYGQILTILNEKYEMTQLEIQKVTQISNKTVAKLIAQYKLKHPEALQRPDDKVVSKSESKVAQKLTEKVTATADKTIEDAMELAIHISDTYLKEAYMRGISLRELVDTAIPTWFNIDGIYNQFLQMERENLTLKERITELKERIIDMEYTNSTLSRRNTNLNRVLVSINQ